MFEFLRYFRPISLKSRCGGVDLVCDETVSPTKWISKTNDPKFVFTRPLQRGWYLVDVIISTERYSNAKIYFAKGGQFNEDDTVSLPTGNGKRIKRVFYVNESGSKLRFDPVENECAFTINHFSIVGLPAFRAKQLMKKKVNSNLLVKDRINTILSECNLFEKYNSCFSPDSATYAEWINFVEPKKDIAIKVNDGPLLSVLMPTYNTDIDMLKSAVQSVLQQTYSNLELCIADDCSTSESVKAYLASLPSIDCRVKVIFRERNGHISEASNSALELASGSHILLLDHDDKLALNALNEIAFVIKNTPDVKIIYSDEDKINKSGKRYDPHFKSGFNHELMLNQNYISHLGCYSKALVDSVGGFRKGYEGAQDYDLLLRCVQKIENDKDIVHIPRILYHWRAIEGSTASAASEKNYTTDAGLIALRDYLSAVEPESTISFGQVPNTYRVQRQISGAPSIELLIPTRDGLDVLRPCIESILSKTKYSNYKITIIDNDSVQPETLSYFSSFASNPNVKIIKSSGVFNFSKVNNDAVKQSNAEFVCLVNNDIEVISPNWLLEMVSVAQKTEVGCVGAKLYYTDGRIQHAGVTLGIGGVAGHTHKYMARDSYGYFSRLLLSHEVSAVTAACLLVRRTTYEKVGGLDEDNLAIAFNDVDFCLKVRKLGLKNIWTPFAELYHHESVSRGAEDTTEKKLRFNREASFMIEKWGEDLTKDPYYNPNLTLIKEDFSLGSVDNG